MEPRISTVEKPKNNLGYGMCNPVIRKMAKKASTIPVTGKAATYSGITRKTIYFLMVCVVGIIGFFVAHSTFMSNVDAYGGAIVMDNIEGMEGIISINTCAIESLIFAGAAIFALFAPLIAWLIRPTIPVVGTLYALCEGYVVGMITQSLGADYKWISFVAFVLTALIVMGMLFIYVKRIIKVTNKFRTVVRTLFFTIIIGGILLFLLSFVPFLNPIIVGITTFMNNPIISIGLSIVYIVIAALFLLVDFDTIEECVENQMPKKLEWMAAFGFVYTIIYIYFKILNLIIKIVALTSKND